MYTTQPHALVSLSLSSPPPSPSWTVTGETSFVKCRLQYNVCKAQQSRERHTHIPPRASAAASLNHFQPRRNKRLRRYPMFHVCATVCRCSSSPCLRIRTPPTLCMRTMRWGSLCPAPYLPMQAVIRRRRIGMEEPRRGCNGFLSRAEPVWFSGLVSLRNGV